MQSERLTQLPTNSSINLKLGTRSRYCIVSSRIRANKKSLLGEPTHVAEGQALCGLCGDASKKRL